jgi:hypothetical protein
MTKRQQESPRQRKVPAFNSDWIVNVEEDYQEENYPPNDLEELTSRVEELEKKLAQPAENDSGRQTEAAYLLGSALAMILSWSKNASILWCIGHGFLSWFYVIYFAYTQRG